VHRDQVAVAEERVHLVDREVLELVVLRGEALRHEERAVPVLLELRALVEVGTVLDRRG